MSRRCREVAELGSAYLDDALDDVERDRLLTHLAACASCRDELDELRTVRELLGRMAAGVAAAPEELSQQLVRIAGQEARVPIWCRPFRRTRVGSLPSGRHQARLRFAVATVSVAALVGGSGVLGYLAAPPEPAAVGDPGPTARAEFAAMLSDLPLSSRPADALMVAEQGQLGRARNALATAVVKAQPVTRTVATAALRRAAVAARHVRYTGVQQVTVGRVGAPVTASVRVEFEPGQGTALTVLGSRGQVVLSRFVSAPRSARVDAQALALLVQHYSVAGWRGERLLGRRATLVEAADPTAKPGRPMARWWVDDATGLVLRQETYDSSGALALSAGFTRVSIRAKPVFLDHLAPRLAMSPADDPVFLGRLSLASASTAAIASRGWHCPDTLAGLSLVQTRSDEQGQPGRVHLLYSDGVQALSVLEQHGALAAPPSGSVWDGAIRAYTNQGSPTMATWRSGTTVLTVVSDAPLALVSRAVADLPHEISATPTTMGRVRAGWSRLIERTAG